MSSSDVENTLREIRNRVRVQMRRQTPSADHHTLSPSQTHEAELESLKANLSVIERSWNRLPPLTSYRSGWVAELELWCKRILKRASHWFTWEQINFNSATSNSLQDVLIVLSAHEEMLSELNNQLEKLAAATAELRTELQELPPKDELGLNNFAEQRPSDKFVAGFTENVSIPDRHRLIDSEIDSLAKRIEELRARRSRLD